MAFTMKKDSPKCPTCKDAHTYRIACKSQYLCHDCHQTFEHYDFEPIDFQWKNEPDKYKEHRRAKLIKTSIDNLKKIPKKKVKNEP